MINLDCDDLFDTWRQQARWLLSHEVDPSLVGWASEGVQDLFASDHTLPESQGPFLARIPRTLLDTLEQAARYRGDQRWSLLYEVLWRVSHGDRTAMMAGDKLGSELQRRIKQVQRESHHLHAFVRFVELPGCVGPEYVAWHEPAHDILHSASVHFIGRMGRHRWLIATPRDGVYYDGEQLNYLRQCPVEWQQMAQNVEDPHGDMWLTYYSHIFNPARLNPKVMEGHLPARFWKNLPEGALIPGLITQARTGKQQDGQASGIKGRQGKRIPQPTKSPPLR
ncbi:TIGR03915 family putative DNA repair protein [Pseudomonas mandelii]|uniref:TIGR03915 family putative DNA repair protein n=1 Tax=Pseudomonas mandelii TaxID=75612 RepID=UPI00224B278B|nr:TIGR03915 family putative DNA repair protein [Pseudomonas mandelii]MCX2900372.1 TIGR03915 family putative DNA repair protein [Pseudomonas mandelii]